MKRYTRKDMSDAMKLALLERLGTVQEIVGNAARVVVTFGDEDILLELSTNWWAELKEVAE